MTKARQSNKESKKPALLSPKEKREAKKVKQESKGAVTPFITPRGH